MRLRAWFKTEDLCKRVDEHFVVFSKALVFNIQVGRFWFAIWLTRLPA